MSIVTVTWLQRLLRLDDVWVQLGRGQLVWHSFGVSSWVLWQPLFIVTIVVDSGGWSCFIILELKPVHHDAIEGIHGKGGTSIQVSEVGKCTCT